MKPISENNEQRLNISADFADRHNGSQGDRLQKMLNAVGYSSLEKMISDIVPENIRLTKELDLPAALHEEKVLKLLEEISGRNTVFRNYIGLGFHETHLPKVILRNVLENPGWYTAYTPYQAEIAQGRLEALLNFQTMITDLTGMEIANASLLDESTAAAEAVNMFYHQREDNGRKVFLSDKCHPYTVDVVRTRCAPLGILTETGNIHSFIPSKEYFAAVIQYPDTDGKIEDIEDIIKKSHSEGIRTAVAADIMSLVLLKPPGEFGADAVVGSTQRFGLPLGFGGPHAGYFATKDEFKRNMPGRLVGVSKDSAGRPAFRLSLQTREQHIRRDKATSNICTAQVLLAVLSSFYAVYHGPNGLRRKAERIHSLASALNSALKEAGHEQLNDSFFDSLKIRPKGTSVSEIRKNAESRKMNFRYFEDGCIGISIPETAEEEDLNEILSVLSTKEIKVKYNEKLNIPEKLRRTSSFLQHPVFNSWHSETEMMRYIHRLESRDLALNTAMIPLGSCTMKLNAVTEMIPVTWKNFSDIHPFAPREQAEGYFRIFDELKNYLCEITGFSAVSLQPNAGSQGEYAGLLTIRNYDASRGQRNRNICLIPVSAHGTNPASAVMAGYTVVPVSCDSEGNVDLNDLRKKCEEHSQNIGVLMITYPSTHGVFEETVKEICTLIHSHGAHVYMDGANMNAQVGLCRPADIGADVCHLNLHKTFCIPHGGGGPGVGPIGVRKHLEDFLPGHSLYDNGSGNREGSVTSSPFGSANILLISYVYIRLMGGKGLKEATMTAILNANYVSKKLEKHYPTLYKGKNGLAAHECILDFRQFKSAGVEVEDIAKRLMDYGFHAPTMSWPVPGTLMVEPTESESLYELDRFIEAMIQIREEIRDAEENRISRTDNPLKNSPHTAEKIASENWTHPYSREKAAYPVKGLRDFKFWPYVGRIDNVYGDRNLFCSCLPMEDYGK